MTKFELGVLPDASTGRSTRAGSGNISNLIERRCANGTTELVGRQLQRRPTDVQSPQPGGWFDAVDYDSSRVGGIVVAGVQARLLGLPAFHFQWVYHVGQFAQVA